MTPMALPSRNASSASSGLRITCAGAGTDRAGRLLLSLCAVELRLDLPRQVQSSVGIETPPLTAKSAPTVVDSPAKVVSVRAHVSSGVSSGMAASGTALLLPLDAAAQVQAGGRTAAVAAALAAAAPGGAAAASSTADGCL